MINIIDKRHEDAIEFSKVEPGSIFEVDGIMGIFVKSYTVASRAYPIGHALNELGEPVHFLDLESWALVTALNVDIVIKKGEKDD